MSNKSPKEGIYMTMYVERNKIKLAKHGLVQQFSTAFSNLSVAHAQGTAQHTIVTCQVMTAHYRRIRL